MKSKVPNETYILPHSLTELAEMSIEEKEMDIAHELLNEAKNYSNYSLDKVLQRRISKSIDIIKGLKKKK